MDVDWDDEDGESVVVYASRACVVCVREEVRRENTEERRCVRIRATGSALDDETVRVVLSLSDGWIADGALAFAAEWDLRRCPVPSVRHVVRCLRWAMANRARLCERNVRLAVLLPQNSARLASTVQFVMGVFGPACPTWVGVYAG